MEILIRKMEPGDYDRIIELWEHIGYTVREDIVYRDRRLAEMKEIFT